MNAEEQARYSRVMVCKLHEAEEQARQFKRIAADLLNSLSLLIFVRHDPDYGDCLDEANRVMQAARDAGV